MVRWKQDKTVFSLVSLSHYFRKYLPKVSQSDDREDSSSSELLLAIGWQMSSASMNIVAEVDGRSTIGVGKGMCVGVCVRLYYKPKWNKIFYSIKKSWGFSPFMLNA